MTHDWVNEVYWSPGALRVMQNAMSAYAVFQGWGNTPERLRATRRAKSFSICVNKLAAIQECRQGAKVECGAGVRHPVKLLPDDKKGNSRYKKTAR